MKAFNRDVVISYLTHLEYSPYGHEGNVHVWSNGENMVPIPEGISVVPAIHIALILKQTGGNLLDIKLHDPL